MNTLVRARLFPFVACLALATMAYPGRATAEPSPILTEEARLLSSVWEPLNGYGFSAAITGDTAFVGAPFDDSPTGEGTVYVFVRSGSSWSEQTVLFPGDGWRRDASFGADVARSGDTLLIGSPIDPTPGGQGSAYVFVRNGSSWSEQAKLLAFSDWHGMRSFGRSVAIDGDTAVIGAPDERFDGYEVGAVYVFVRDGSSWSEQARLLPPRQLWGTQFGRSVAISGDWIAVGEPTGQAVYLFFRSGSSWSQQARLIPWDEGASGANSDFGESVALSGDTLAVGAPSADSPKIERTGAMYVFVRSGSSWIPQARLHASDAAREGYFSREIDLLGDTLVTGRSGGPAHVFRRVGSAWSEQARLLPEGIEQYDYHSFGDSVAVSGDTVVVGAMTLGRQGELDPGTAYVFSIALAPGVAVAPASGLVTWEWGGSADVYVSLNTRPAGTVVIDIASSDPGEGTVSPAQLTFTPVDWATPQTVTLTGVDDFVVDDGQLYTVALTMNTELTEDPIYDGTDPPDVSAVNLPFEGDFYTVTPCRVLDTRLPDQGPPLVSGVERVVTFHGVCGVPETARAVAFQVTMVHPTSGGKLTLYPGDLPKPDLGTVFFAADRNRTCGVIVLLAVDGTGTLTAVPLLDGGGSTHLVIDVSGYFE